MRGRHGYGWLVALALLGMTARAADPPAGPATVDPLDRRIDELADALLARSEAVAELEEQLADRKLAADTLAAEFRRAEDVLTLARAEEKQFREVTLPTEKKEILAQLKSAETRNTRAQDLKTWSEQMAARGSIPETEPVSYRLILKQTSANLATVKKRLEILEQNEVPQAEADLKAAIVAAEAEISKVQSALSRSRTREADTAKRLDAAYLSVEESAAILLLDETIQLRDRGQKAEARSKIEEARTLWVRAESRRIAARSDEIKRRVSASAERLRRREAGKPSGATSRPEGATSGPSIPPR